MEGYHVKESFDNVDVEKSKFLTKIQNRVAEYRIPIPHYKLEPNGSPHSPGVTVDQEVKNSRNSWFWGQTSDYRYAIV